MSDVVELPLGWIVRWVDVDGREHETRVPDCPVHVARISVATQFIGWFDEFIDQPKRVIRP